VLGGLQLWLNKPKLLPPDLLPPDLPPPELPQQQQVHPKPEVLVPPEVRAEVLRQQEALWPLRPQVELPLKVLRPKWKHQTQKKKPNRKPNPTQKVDSKGQPR